MKYLLTAALICLASVASAGHGQGAFPPGCGPTVDVSSNLETKYGETIKSTGLMKNGKATLQLWTSDESGTWTITVMSQDGLTMCVKATGQNWKLITELEPVGTPL